MLEEHRKVTKYEGEQYSKKNNFIFFEVSAKENINIRSLFFQSIIELPFFNQFKSSNDFDKKALLEEFEYENNDFSNTMLPGAINDSSRINISMVGGLNANEQRKRCKC